MNVQKPLISNKISAEIHLQKEYKYQYPKGPDSFAPFSVKLNDFPCLIPVPLKTDIGGLLEAFRGASAPRLFNLDRDWEIRIDTYETDNYDGQDFSGTVIIPTNHPEKSGQKTQFDGASVPYPWLISFLSFGILRPIGVMLTASLVHDFAFEYGGLLYRDESGKTEFRPVERHHADQLFYDIIKTVNKMPRTAIIAWLAVRLGWFGVKYNGQYRTGKFPLRAFSILVAVIATLFALLATSVATLGFKMTAYIVFGLYVAVFPFYAFIFLLLKLTAPKAEQS
ncbi:MAG: DUF1353 domain-containing protein [Thainema sp.]